MQAELLQSLGIAYDYNSYYLPSGLKQSIDPFLKARQQESTALEQQNDDQSPLYIRVFRRYNVLADKLKQLHLSLRQVSKRLANLVPRLPRVHYNDEKTNNQVDRTAPKFDNNLLVSRTTNNAFTLYQFNAEYRDRLREMAERLLSVKTSILRGLSRYSFRALINKYKPRSLNSYTMVASVYKRRNVLAFNGELRVLKSKCRFLLAHELSKNQFSIVLNNNDEEEWISVSAYGQPLISVGPTRATLNKKTLTLPYNQNRVSVRRVHNGVSLEVNNDLQVTCYEDSNSCTIALTRFYTGKVNGLLGQSNQDLNTRLDESYWFLDSKCTAVTQQTVLKSPSQEAVKTCYTFFGKHRRAVLRDAFQVVRPNGWQRVCENALNLNSSVINRCSLLRAFVNHARLRQVEVNEPNECCKFLLFLFYLL